MKISALIVALSLIGLSTANAVIIADFDSGTKPNNVGGDFGAWDKDPADDTQSAREDFNAENARMGQGFCMQLSYDVDSPNAAYNGFWMKLGTMDATKLTKVIFWAKADATSGCTARMKVELKNASERGSFYIDGISKEWTKFEIPLTEFNVSDLTALEELVVVFEDHTSMPKAGVLYLDDVSFE